MQVFTFECQLQYVDSVLPSKTAYYFLCHHVQINSAVHPPFNTVGNGDSLA
jgi:hypothetical protein